MRKIWRHSTICTLLHLTVVLESTTKGAYSTTHFHSTLFKAGSSHSQLLDIEKAKNVVHCNLNFLPLKEHKKKKEPRTFLKVTMVSTYRFEKAYRKIPTMCPRRNKHPPHTLETLKY